MIKRSELIPIGVFAKPHGIKGEIAAQLDYDISPANLRCIVTDIDGVYVPFFISSCRPKTAMVWLLLIDGINNEDEAKALSRKEIYAIKDELPALDEEVDDTDGGMYASDFIGYRALLDDCSTLGEITDIDDTTENVLFIVTTPDGRSVLIPVADEFIVDIDTDNTTITLSLPEGLID